MPSKAVARNSLANFMLPASHKEQLVAAAAVAAAATPCGLKELLLLRCSETSLLWVRGQAAAAVGLLSSQAAVPLRILDLPSWIVFAASAGKGGHKRRPTSVEHTSVAYVQRATSPDT